MRYHMNKNETDGRTDGQVDWQPEKIKNWEKKKCQCHANCVTAVWTSWSTYTCIPRSSAAGWWACSQHLNCATMASKMPSSHLACFQPIFKHSQSGQLLRAPWTGVLPEIDLICQVITYKHTVFKSVLHCYPMCPLHCFLWKEKTTVHTKQLIMRGD